MGFSRMVLGVHSLNQILYGFLLGLWSLYAVLSYIQPLVLQNQQTIRDIILVRKGSVGIYVGIVCGIISTLLITCVLIFLTTKLFDDFDLDPSERDIIEACRGGVVVTELDIEGPNFVSSGGMALVIGSYLGIVYRLKRGIEESRAHF
mmetsp:Transcript_508/g.981  ORF Transcript_508/g.981 Transcript_508/m.981 type:complete len:148 (+) Transcript_508:743-1186(+)